MKDKYILLAIPMESEFEALSSALGDRLSRKTIGGIRGYTFKCKRGQVFAYESSVGRVNSAIQVSLLSTYIEIEWIINVGSAGSLMDSVKPLDVVIAKESAYYDVDLTPFGYAYGQMSKCPQTFVAKIPPLDLSSNSDYRIHIGLIITADSFITSKNVDYDKLDNFTSPLCLDMEGAAFGQVAYKLNVPYTLIRGISDEITKPNNSVMHDKIVTKCTANAIDVLLKMID